MNKKKMIHRHIWEEKTRKKIDLRHTDIIKTTYAQRKRPLNVSLQMQKKGIVVNVNAKKADY